MTFIKGFDHVQICIPNGAEEQARVFYSGILQLEEIEKPDTLKPNGGVWFQAGDRQLHLGTEDMGNEAKGKRHVAFSVNNIGKVRELMESHSIEIKEEKPIPGAERFTIRDPWGNRLEFITYNR